MRGGPEKIRHADSLIGSVSGGDANLQDIYKRTVNLAVAGDILKQHRDRSTPTSMAPGDSLSGVDITDPDLRLQVDKLVYTFDADTVINRINSYDLDLPHAKEQLSKNVPEVAKEVRDYALQAAENKVVLEALDRYGSSMSTPQDAQKLEAAIAQMTDPSRQQQARSIVEGYAVVQLVRDLTYGRKDSRDVTALLSKTTDGPSKLLLQKALRDADTAYGDMWELESDMRHRKDALLGDSGSPFTTEYDKARDASYDYQNQFYHTLDVAEIQFDADIGAKSGIRPAPAPPELTQERYSHATIDLSRAPTYSVVNAFRDGKERPDVLEQFAEVYARDGHLQLDVIDGLDDMARAHLQQAFETNRPLIEAAFAKGVLVSVRFVLETENDVGPRYQGASREIVMPLPKDASISADELTSTLTHESVHSLVREYFSNLTVGEVERQQLAQACFDLRGIAYQDMQTNLRTHPELLSNLRAAVRPEHLPVIDLLKRAVDAGTLSSLQKDGRVYDSPASNRCDYLHDSLTLLDDTASRVPELQGARTVDLSYLFQTPAFVQYDQSMVAMSEYASVLSLAVNESNYIRTNSPYKDLYGHAGDDANELYASVVNAALNYPEELKAGMARLATEKQEILKRFLNLAIQTLNVRYPSLHPLLNNAQHVLE